MDWITALRAPAIRALAEAGVVQPSLFDERDLAEITTPAYPGERLVACRNPLLAEERARKRQELLAATEQELDRIVAATGRAKSRLRGRDQIGLRVGKVLNRFKMGKHFRLEITADSFRYRRDDEALAAEAALDGIYIVRASLLADRLLAEQIVRAYKGLAVAEDDLHPAHPAAAARHGPAADELVGSTQPDTSAQPQPPPQVTTFECWNFGLGLLASLSHTAPGEPRAPACRSRRSGSGPPPLSHSPLSDDRLPHARP